MTQTVFNASAWELTQGIRRAARLTPNRVAIRCDGRSRTWAEFQERVSRAAAIFQWFGVERGDRVAMLALNSDYYVEFMFASMWAGGVAVPLNTRWAEAELAECLGDAEPRVLLVDAEHADLAVRLRDSCRSIQVVLIVGSHEHDRAQCYEELLRKHGPVEDARRGGDDLACLFYTGGTTGRSKGVMLTHANLTANSLVAIANMGFAADTVHLHVSPLFHVAGGARLFSVTQAGGTHVVVPRFDPETFLETLARERVTVTIIVPAMLNQLVQRLEAGPEISELDLSHLRLLTYGASPMPEALLRRAFSALPGVQFMQGYGMTECAPLISTLGSEYHRADDDHTGYLASAGQPVCTAEVAILDERGCEAQTGEVGEVCVRGPMVMKGYWGMPDATAQALQGGWMHTGDAGYLDDAGFLFLVDRVKDMIVTGGENVYSAEVEAALHQHSDVLECAVIGVPDDQWGEAVHAVVVPKPGTDLSPETLDAVCRRNIAGFKCPKEYTFRHEPLPRSGAGKVVKTELRMPFWQHKDRQIQ